MFSLKGKTILITGSSSGIGRTIAVTLSKQEACVIITGRDPTRLKETFDSLTGESHLQIIADLTRKEDIEALATKISTIDGVVFCAGIINYVTGKQIDVEKMNQILQINYISQVLLYQALHLNKKLLKGASLIFISSVSALSAVPGTILYAASKAAVSSSVRILASELAKFKIRVNGISPGLIKTPLLDNENLEAETLRTNEARHPLGLGEAIDVANAVVFLMSDEARWITGIDLIVDGGYMLHK